MHREDYDESRMMSSTGHMAGLWWLTAGAVTLHQREGSGGGKSLGLGTYAMLVVAWCFLCNGR